MSRALENNSTKWLVAFAMLLTTIFCSTSESLARMPVWGNETEVSPSDTIEKTSEKGPVKLTVRVSPKAPRLSDLVEFEILVVAKEQIAIEPPSFGQAVGDFLVRDFGERNRDMFGNQVAEHSRLFRYQLEPVQTGLHLIRSIAIEFTDNRPDSESVGQKLSIDSEPLEVTVSSELGDAIPDLANLEPMVAPKSLESSRAWIWIGTAFLLLFPFLLLLWLTRKTPAKAVVEPQRSPEEIAKEELEKLLAEDLPSKGLFKDFYLRLTGIVRNYIEGSTGLKAPEQTTEEFLREARSRDLFTLDQSQRLQDFLEAADMVKYAGQTPEAQQIEQSIHRAHEFIGGRS